MVLNTSLNWAPHNRSATRVKPKLSRILNSLHLYGDASEKMNRQTTDNNLQYDKAPDCKDRHRMLYTQHVQTD